MGIDPTAIAQANSVKEFDFIYTGSTAPNRDIDRLLNIFIRDEWKEKRLMMLSQDYDHLAKKYSAHENILFEGPVAHDHVAGYILRSRFGINFIPDREPFNRQTSTKFLEYASLQTPIISSRYAWVETFQETYGGNYFYLNEDASNFTWDGVNRYEYSFPDLSEWSWDKQIRKSGVLEFLKRL
jgi:glycosyltransferase involved in cell wall biosynthesis